MVDSNKDEPPSISSKSDAPNTIDNKRKIKDVGGDDINNNNNNPLLTGEGPNKRRKKNKKKKKQQANANNKHKQNKNKKKQQNWIEICSDSIHRIPSQCTAPLTCVITRVEIEEEPLLPKNQAANDKNDNDDNDVSAEGCIAAGDEKVIKSDINPTPENLVAAATDANTINDTTLRTTSAVDDVNATRIAATNPNIHEKLPNIARPSLDFISQYTKEKDEWKIPTTIQTDNEEKKLFIPVKRHSSAKGPTKWAQEWKKGGKKQQFNCSHLPHGDNGDGILNPYPSSVVPDKFWAQRKRLFSRYDDGIQIGGKDDPEMWYSVTPESIANHVAQKMVKMMTCQSSQSAVGSSESISSDKPNSKSITILDVFCGCGGNSIAFARLNNVQKKDEPHVKVIAVDNNLNRLRMAANNAAIYNIRKKDMLFIHADAIEVLNHYGNGAEQNEPSQPSSVYNHHEPFAGYEIGGIDMLPDRLDGVFLSPPWGGMEYSKQASGKAGFDPVSSITIESCSEDTVKQDVESSKPAVKTNGGELLSLTAKAFQGDSKLNGTIAYFLPRNTDGVALGQIAAASGIEGSFEMEQNVVNGKVKTVTAYFGQENV